MDAADPGRAYRSGIETAQALPPPGSPYTSMYPFPRLIRPYAKPTAFFNILFAPPSGRLSDNWDRELIVGWSTDAGFQEKLATAIRQTLDHPFRRLAEVEDLYRLMQEDRLHWQHQNELLLEHDAFLHASVLAALGRLPEASAVAQAHIDKDESRWLAVRARGEALLEKPRKR